MLKLYSKVTPKVGNCFIWIGVIYTEMYWYIYKVIDINLISKKEIKHEKKERRTIFTKVSSKKMNEKLMKKKSQI
jgi:hypothetical protein